MRPTVLDVPIEGSLQVAGPRLIVRLAGGGLELDVAIADAVRLRRRVARAVVPGVVAVAASLSLSALAWGAGLPFFGQLALLLALVCFLALAALTVVAVLDRSLTLRVGGEEFLIAAPGAYERAPALARWTREAPIADSEVYEHLRRRLEDRPAAVIVSGDLPPPWQRLVSACARAQADEVPRLKERLAGYERAR